MSWFQDLFSKRTLPKDSLKGLNKHFFAVRGKKSQMKTNFPLANFIKSQIQSLGNWGTPSLYGSHVKRAMQLNYLFETDKKSLSLNSPLKNSITSPANYVWGAPLPYGLFVPELNPKITYSLYNEVDHEDYEVMAEVEPEYVEVEDEPEEGGISEGKRGDSEFWAARGKKEADFWAAR